MNESEKSQMREPSGGRRLGKVMLLWNAGLSFKSQLSTESAHHSTLNTCPRMQQDRVHNATEGNTLKFKSVAVIAGVQELSIERHEPEALNPESAGSDPSTPAVLKTAQGRLPERKHNRSWSANLADFIFGGSSATSPTREQPSESLAYVR